LQIIFFATFLLLSRMYKRILKGVKIGDAHLKHLGANKSF